MEISKNDYCLKFEQVSDPDPPVCACQDIADLETGEEIHSSIYIQFFDSQRYNFRPISQLPEILRRLGGFHIFEANRTLGDYEFGTVRRLDRRKPQGIIAVLAPNRKAAQRIATEDFKQYISWVNEEVYSIELTKGDDLIDWRLQYYGEPEDAIPEQILYIDNKHK